jgi:succinyl-CoA synthetase beta subunit
VRLYEYQLKSLFAQFGIPIPKGKNANTPQKAADIAYELNEQLVLKPQLLSENNSKNTGIKFAQTAQMAQEYAFSIIGKPIDGQIVDSILVEAAATFTTKIYVAIVTDYELNKPVMIVSEKDSDGITYTENGLDFFIHETIDPFIGFLEYQARELAGSINLPFEYWNSFTKIIQGLFRCYIATDALSVEIDPLVLTDKNEFLALGGSIVIDDNALYRQVELAKMNRQPKSEIQVQHAEISYRKMNGEIACAINGLGLALTILDMINLYGNEAKQSAKLIDMGEEAQTHRIETALRIIFSDIEIKVAFINIWGGITGCDAIALSILQIIEDTQTQMPVIIRLTGERAHEGQSIINDSQFKNLFNALTLTEAVQKVITAATAGRIPNGNSC